MTTTTDIVITRVFAAPRDLVFRCMTEPEHLTAFWGPQGTRTPIENITVDLRVGGTFETVMVNETDGQSYAMRCAYTEIDPPERLAWADQDTGVSVTSTFADLGDGRTEVTILQEHVPAAFQTPEARAGFLTSLDRLDAHLLTLA